MGCIDTRHHGHIDDRLGGGSPRSHTRPCGGPRRCSRLGARCCGTQGAVWCACARARARARACSGGGHRAGTGDAASMRGYGARRSWRGSNGCDGGCLTAGARVGTGYARCAGDVGVVTGDDVGQVTDRCERGACACVRERQDGVARECTEIPARKRAIVAARRVDELGLERIDAIGADDLGRVAGGITVKAALVRTQAEGHGCRPVPDDIAVDAQGGIGTTRIADIAARTDAVRPLNGEVLPGALHTGRVVDDVVGDGDIAVGDEFAFAADRRGAPATTGQVCGASGRRGSGVAVAGAIPERNLDEVAGGAYTIEGVVGKQDVIATVDSHASPQGIVDDVVDEGDVRRFVMNPGGHHVFKTSPLASHKSADVAIVDFVGFDTQICRTPFGVHAPVGGVVDAVPVDVSVLDGDIVDGVFGAAADVVGFEVDIL